MRPQAELWDEGLAREACRRVPHSNIVDYTYLRVSTFDFKRGDGHRFYHLPNKLSNGITQRRLNALH